MPSIHPRTGEEAPPGFEWIRTDAGEGTEYSLVRVFRSSTPADLRTDTNSEMRDFARFRTDDQVLDATLELLQRGTGDPIEILRDVSRRLIPTRRAAVQESLLQSQRQASGSMRELFSQFNDQIGQIQTQIQNRIRTIGRQGGFSAGGQREVGQEQIVAQGASEYADLITQLALQGTQGRFEEAANVNTGFSVQPPPPATSSTSRTPFDLNTLGGTLTNAQALLGRLLTPSTPITPNLLFPDNLDLTGTTVTGVPLTGTSLTPPASQSFSTGGQIF